MVSMLLFLSGSKMDVINQSKKLRELYQLVSTDSIKAGKTWCEFGANLVQHSMRQYPKYQTICDYTPTISHDMSVTHDVKRCETSRQKLQALNEIFGLSKCCPSFLGSIFSCAVLFCFEICYNQWNRSPAHKTGKDKTL